LSEGRSTRRRMPETAGLLESTLRLCGLAVAVTAHLLDRVVAAEPPQPCQHRCGVLEEERGAAGQQQWLRTGGDCPHDRRGEESVSRPSAVSGGRRVVRLAIRNRTPDVGTLGRMSGGNSSCSNSSGIYISNSGHSSHLCSTSSSSSSDSVDSGRLRASSSCPALVSQPTSPHARQLTAASHCHTPHLSAPRCQNKQLIDPRSCHVKLATAVNTRCRILQVSGHFLCSSGLLRRSSSSRRLSTIWEEEDDSQDSWRTHRRQLSKTPSLRHKAAFDAAAESDAKTGRCTRSLGRERTRYGYRSRA
jgi:hypothetical protein